MPSYSRAYPCFRKCVVVGVEQLAVAKNACWEEAWKQLLNPQHKADAFIGFNGSELSEPTKLCESDGKHNELALFRGFQAVVDWQGLQ